MLGKLRQHNITIIVSTPYMDEAMRCDRVALIQREKSLSIDRPRKIREGFSRKLFMLKAPEKYKLLTALKKISRNNNCLSFRRFGTCNIQR